MAGISEKMNKIITIFFASIIIVLSFGFQTSLYGQSAFEDNSSNSQGPESQDKKVNDSIRNPDFEMTNSTSGLPLYWDDSFGVCGSTFDCTMNSTDGWFSNSSFQLSTQNNTNSTWSWISSQPIVVSPNEKYEIITHMKLNEWVTQSHILLEGYNSSTDLWYQIEQCPVGTNGPLKWKIFDCKITIPADTTSILLTLNAGWSSQSDKKAVTTFDAIHAYKTT